jgi:16S rRNA (adenine(1408)-N(1))-methyltransferase
VRRIVGRQVVDLPSAELAVMRERFGRLLLDVGTGDGKHALRLARQRPDWLVIGLDSNRDNLRKVSQRAATRQERGGTPNVLFVWAAAEQLPPAIADVDEVHVLMPWGSLLRGMLGSPDQILAGLARVSRPGADLLCTLNLHAWRPPVKEVGDTPEPTPEWAMDTLRQVYAPAGWTLREAHYADERAEAPLTTAWSRRLNATRDRFDVLVLRATRPT